MSESANGLDRAPARLIAWTPGRVAPLFLLFMAAAIAWLLTKPVYQSTGVVQIASFPSNSSQPDPELMVARSERVAQLALTSETWRTTVHSEPVDGSASFLSRLQTRRIDRGAMQFTFSDFTAEAAQAGAWAAMNAFHDVQHATSQRKWQRRAEMMESRATLCADRLSRLKARIARAAELGQSDLSPDLAESVRVLRLELAQAESAVTGELADLKDRLPQFKIEASLDHYAILKPANLPAAALVDHRLRNSFLATFATFISLLTLRKLMRLWKNRARSTTPRSAFPVIMKDLATELQIRPAETLSEVQHA